MNQKEYQMIFQIGANHASSFNTSFGSACKKLNELAKETAETSKMLKDVSGFQKAKDAVTESKQKLEILKEEYKNLQTSIVGARHDVEKFPTAIEKQKEIIKETIKTISQHQQALQNYDEGTAEYKELNAEIKKGRQELREHQKEYKNLIAAQANAQKSYQNITDNMVEHDKQIEKTNDAIEKQQEAVYKYSRKLEEAGINVNNLTEEQKRLQEQYEDFKSAREHLQKVGAEYDELTQKAREQAAEVGKLIGVYAAAGAALYKGAIEPAIEFESAYTGVLKTVDGTPEQLQRIKEDILDLSTTVPTAASDIAAVAEAGGSAVSKLLKQFEVMYWNDDETTPLDERVLNDYAKVAGVTIDEFKEIYGKDSLEAVSMFISGLNDVERNGKNAVQILSDLDITEIRMSNAVLSLAASDGILTDAVNIANAAWEENTALAEEAGKRYATTESQIQMAKNSMNNAGIALGEVFTPYVAEAARGINEFAQNTAEWVRDNPNAVKHIALFAGKVGGATLAFKGLNLAWTGIQTLGQGIQKTFAMGAGAANAAALGISAVAVAAMAAYEWLKMN